ncbi:hypothetical protein CEXT_293441 [Caerostris extrusa]|uniref:Uncharacterized protein n=1 Tax=Caerostris extrusa TaxID=172846 RepID=A0AAV4Q2S4_CAEEX|nr:hypothetical protein CEXT_293441 [Caerostris extrusa]
MSPGDCVHPQRMRNLGQERQKSRSSRMSPSGFFVHYCFSLVCLSLQGFDLYENDSQVIRPERRRFQEKYAIPHQHAVHK